MERAAHRTIGASRSTAGRLAVLAAFLRRLANWLDAPEAEPEPDLIAISRAGLREVQTQGLQMVADYAALGRDDDGMLWFPRSVLKSIEWLIAVELEGRDRDFALVERDPKVRLQ